MHRFQIHQAHLDLSTRRPDLLLQVLGIGHLHLGRNKLHAKLLCISD